MKFNSFEFFSKALEWLRENYKTTQSRESLPVTKEALAAAIRNVCYSSRRVPMIMLIGVLSEVGVLVATPVAQLKDDELNHTDPDHKPSQDPLEKEIQNFVKKVKIRYADNWETILQSRKTKRALSNLLPVYQLCFPKIFEILV